MSLALRRWTAERRVAVALRLESAKRALVGLLAWPRRLRVALGPARVRSIVLVPQDLRTADPVRADELAAGTFIFAGHRVIAQNPFSVIPPSQEWAEQLAGFAWLRHLRSAGTPEAAEAGRRLVLAWLEAEAPDPQTPRAEFVAAERLRAFLGASGLLLAGADQVFYRRFNRSLWRQLRHLEARLPRVEPGIDRLSVLITLVTAGLCLSGEERLVARAGRMLAAELDAQIMPDGCHVSRHPGVIVGLILDLLSLRQLFPTRSATPPTAIVTAVDRMMPMIRFFQLGDGALARFNGMGATPIDQVVTALVYDGTRGTAPLSAGHGGYERLQAGQSIVLVDAGVPPPARHSAMAHAGCLSFEFSIGREPLVINCGVPSIQRAAWQVEARKTAAHSTLSVADRSSLRLGRGGAAHGRVLAGPTRVEKQRKGQTLMARHDGYVPAFDIVHERRLRLDETGDRLDGEDLVEGSDQPYAIRFHLHPSVKVIPTEFPQAALLRLPSGEGWRFLADHPVIIEPSVSLAQPEGPRRTAQIVVAVPSSAAVPRVIWSFQKLDRSGRRSSGAEAEQPEVSSQAELPLPIA